MKSLKVQILFCILLLSIALLITAFSSIIVNNEEHGLETITLPGFYIKFDSEKKLYDFADLIVIAKTDKSFKEREHHVSFILATDSEEPKKIADIYTKTPIKIKEVLKKPYGSNIYKNDDIIIIEPLALQEDGNGMKKLTIENYHEIEKGQKYILYLKKNTYGEYSIVNMNNGRFNLDVEENIFSMEEHEHRQAKEDHEEMKTEVTKKFHKQIFQMFLDAL